MSRDGKYFVFESVLSTHVEGDTDEKNDIFLLDIASGDISLISTGLSVSYYAPTISSTGKYITYYGGAKSSMILVYT
jgi:Tol biopolymer transport system component